MKRPGVFGLDTVLRNLGKVKTKADKAFVDANNASALLTQSEARRSIQRDAKSGVTYSRGSGQNKSGSHTASAPGESPATDTGVLASGTIVERATASRPVARTGPSDRVNYAKRLEYGTRHMAARPFMRPAFNKVRKTHNKRVSDYIKKALEL